MIRTIRKWAPFILILIIAVVMSFYLIFVEQDSAYVPDTDKPDLIFREACLGCHGDRGQGTGLFYPALAEEKLSEQEIRHYVTEGDLFMPAFKQIKGDTLNALVDYVLERRYLRQPE